MDGIGTLDITWAQGYDGGNAEYITKDTLCYKCGNNVKFVKEDGTENVYSTNGNRCVAVHGINKVFAYADNQLPPVVHIIAYPSLQTKHQLKDGAKIEYVQMKFSTSEYIATITGVPEYQLIVWHYTDGTQLCNTNLTSNPPACIAFNPANWRQLAYSTQKELTLWNIEACDNTFIIKKSKTKLPVVEGELDGDEERDVPTRASTRMTRVTLNLPQTSIAGIKGDEAEKFDEYSDRRSKAMPTCHLWTPAGDLLVGCADGQILKVDGESLKVYSLFTPSPRAQSAYSRIDSAQPSGREKSHMTDPSAQSSSELTLAMGDGSVNCMALHKHGLYAAGEDGVLRHLEVTADRVRVKQAYPVGVPISSMSFNGPHNRLGMGSNKGSLYMYEPGDNAGVRQISDIHFGNFVGVHMLSPGNEHCVSVRENGEVQVWNIESAKLVSSTSIGQQAVSLAASPGLSVAVVGTTTGHVCCIDLANLENPRMVHCMKLYNSPVKHLVFALMGNFLLTGSDEPSVFVVDGRATKTFQPLGYITVPGPVEAISTIDEGKGLVKGVVTANTSGQSGGGATKIIHFNLSDKIPDNPASYHASLKCDFDDDAIKRITYNFSSPSHGACVVPDGCALVLTNKTKQLNKLPLPNEPPKKENSKDSFLQPMEEQPGHQLAGGSVVLSPHLKWLATCGSDGRLTMRAVSALDRTIEVMAHDYRQGGIRSVAFTADSSAVITCGNDGVISCYRWNFNQKGAVKAKSAIESARARQTKLLSMQKTENQAIAAMPEWSPELESRPSSGQEKAEKEQLEKEMAIESAIEKDEIYLTPTPTPGANATWADKKELEAIKEEDKEYSDVKEKLRSEIREMRRKLKVMMKDNEHMADIEKLNHYEFDLDMEEQRRLQAEGEADVERIREEMELENLAKMYLADLIKKECWDNMVVKGRGIGAFNSTMEVSNYPMKARTSAELKKLHDVQEQREIEIEEFQGRKELAEITQKTASASQDDEPNEGEETDCDNVNPSTSGSLGTEYGGGSKLFYTQFELHTREQKINQIVLLEDAIYRIKEHFNKEFGTVYEKKEQEIAKIKDKNKRIRKIIEDLELDVEIYEPELGIIEKPENLLFVEDSEVKVERHLTEAQRKKLEEEQKAEEERRLREKGDNWRDRGLDLMMGGVLEVKKEDVLKKDIPQPVFMTAKNEEDWSDEEKKQAADYEKKVKDLEEEREKYRKQLEMELKKLYAQIQEGTTTFDEALQQLFHRKIKTEMVVYQEELKMLRLRYALLLEEELNNREDELNDLLQFKKDMKHLSNAALAQARKQVDAFREQYDILVAEDKVMDKAFKREFHDVPAVQVEQLYKLFRRRPRGQKARGGDTPIYDPSSGNPFAERPSTARQNDMHRAAMDTALVELDRETNAPENVEPHIWERMCQYRRQKIESEQLVKQKALVMAEMQAFLNKRQEEDEIIRNEIDDLLTALNRLKDDRLRFTYNLQVQLLLKQGQVEVDAGPFIHDYKESLLLHRSAVEDLNSKIRHLGESKINSMVESKDFRKSIVQLEWEHKRMTMEMEDLQNKMRDIQMLKVTREIQGFLNEEDHESKKVKEIQTLEQTLVMQTQNHEKNVDDRKRTMRELKRTIWERTEENASLTRELEELNVSVNERRHIHEVNADKRSDAGAEQRYREIVQRRKLVELAKAQAQEVAVLRAEVERLRMRTFPALVQVEH